MSLFFYKNGNSWVLGETSKSFMPTGKYFLKEVDATHVDLFPVDRNVYVKYWENIAATDIKKNEAGDLYASKSELLTAVADFFADASSGGGDATTLQTHPASYFQTALGFTPEQAGVASGLITAIKDGVSTNGDTLNKLYNLIISSYSEITKANITERNAYNITKLPTNVFVTDDGDGKWALYKAITTGTNATYIKLSDPDLLNQVMTASQIAAAYEGISDVNRFTNALKQNVVDFSNWLATNSANLLAHLVDAVSHITSVERTTWNGKATQAARVTFNNADLTISATTSTFVTQIGNLTAPRNVTLPAASSFKVGDILTILDQSGTVNSTNTLTVTRSGSDTIDGSTNVVIGAAYGWRRFISDGVGNWSYDAGVLRAYNNLSDLTNLTQALTNLGLQNVNNTSDANKPVSTAQAAAITSAISVLTKASVGLGNVDNTSDANKPVSTAQAAADTAILNQSFIYALIFG
jgi:hypothetical protein